MGLQAVYFAVPQSVIADLTAMTDEQIEDAVEHLEEAEDGCASADLDKMWDGLHFLLTGVPGSEPITEDPLSEAIIGIDNVCEEPFVTVTSAAESSRLLAALRAVDIKHMLHQADFASFQKAQVYPAIWEEDPEQLRAELGQAYTDLVDFYRLVVEADCGVVVTIF